VAHKFNCRITLETAYSGYEVTLQGVTCGEKKLVNISEFVRYKKTPVVADCQELKFGPLNRVIVNDFERPLAPFLVCLISETQFVAQQCGSN